MGFVEREGTANTRSFRIDRAIDSALGEEAERQGLSVSSLTERIVEDYINFGRWLERQKALTILASTMKEFLEPLDEDEIRLVGEKVGARIPRQSMLMRGVSIDGDAARDHIMRILGEHDNWFTVSYHEQPRPYYFIRNSLGEKWIIFVEAYMRAFYRENLGIGVECVRVGDNLQVLI